MNNYADRGGGYYPSTEAEGAVFRHTKAEFGNCFFNSFKIFLCPKKGYLLVKFLRSFGLFLGMVSGYKQTSFFVQKLLKR